MQTRGCQAQLDGSALKIKEKSATIETGQRKHIVGPVALVPKWDSRSSARPSSCQWWPAAMVPPVLAAVPPQRGQGFFLQRGKRALKLKQTFCAGL
jgi:hypothetical protein